MKIVLALLAVIAASMPAIGAPVNPGAQDGIVSRWITEGRMYALDSTGQSWMINAGSPTWTRLSHGLPVPIEQIADWYGCVLVANDGTTWHAQGFNSDGVAVWSVVPQMPTGPVLNSSTTIGSLKGMFR